MFRTANASIALVFTAMLVGCDGKPASTATPAAPNAAATASPSALPADLFLAAAPADAKDIKDAKPTLKAGDKVVLVGRIGGSEEPFVAERAMFTLVDRRMKLCDEGSAMPACKTPWDLCCDTREDITASSTTVQVVDANGKPVKAELNGMRGLKPAATVTVVGTIAQADGENVVVSASGFFVSP